MCVGGGGPSIPPPAPLPPPPVVTPQPTPATPSQPKLADASVKKAKSDVEKRARQFAGTRGGTLITGPSGLETDANIEKKTLLGA
ncbi:MAG: hypothetical protein CMB80_01740 [Flammeovirgaceae bacterium]|nr:hypothetical protein [Flammeovirgaceae bacterium]|tara:strand:+ start:776 stop:1030 length:255 start_codon:yes stop_codon:yes gene_type:complete